MNTIALIYGIIGVIVAIVAYCIFVAQSADDDAIIAILLGCTLFPIAAILLGIAWPLALLATGIRMAVRD